MRFLNTILDPLFIFTFHMGMAGAALATIIGQIISGIMVIAYLCRFKTVKLTFKALVPSPEHCRAILSLGMAPCFNQLAMMIVQIVMNNILRYYGAQSNYGSEIPLACAGIITKVNMIFFSLVIGLSQGLQPIVSFNYGARQRSRITGVIHFALVLSAAIMAVGTVVFLAIPGPLLRLFDADAAVLAEGISALRLIALSFVCAGVSVILCAALQALGAANSSLVVSLLRQLVLLFPLALLLGALRPSLVWLAFLLSEGAACLTALLLYRRTARGRLAGMEE